MTKTRFDQISSERLDLRLPHSTDAEAVAGLMCSEVSQWLASWPPKVDADEVSGRISEARADVQSGQALHWLIHDRQNSQVLGWVRIMVNRADVTRGELGFWIGALFHGRGYATEAARVAVRAGFDHLGLDVIEGGAQTANIASQKVMLRIGMKPSAERDVWAAARQRYERCAYFEIGRFDHMGIEPIA